MNELEKNNEKLLQAVAVIKEAENFTGSGLCSGAL